MVVLLGPAAVVQILAPRLDSLRAQTAGLVIMVVGVAVLLAAALSKSLAVLIIAALLGDIGMGLSFMGSANHAASRVWVGAPARSPPASRS